MSTIELNNAIAYINTFIKANNNNEITGVVMNNVLKDLVNRALNGLHFIGIVDSNSTLPINTPFAALAVGADTIEGVTIPSGCIAIVYNNGETGDTTQVKILINVSALILAHNTSNTAHNDIRTTLQNLCDSLQAQIDALSSSSDVVDVVADYTELQNYDTSGLSDKDIVKVLEDSTHDDATTYYRWVVVGGVGQWVYVGEQGAYYTKAEADARFAVAASLSALRTIVVGTTTCVTTTSGAVGLANGDSSKCVIVTDNELYIAHSGNKYEAIDGDSEEYGNGGLVKENDVTKFKVIKGTTSVELEKDGDVNIDASGNDVNVDADAIKLNGNDVVTENQIGAAGFTNDYEDLDNKPAIPAQGDYIEQLQQQLNKLFVVLSDGVPTLQRYKQGAIGILSNIGKLIFANYTALLQGSNVEINTYQSQAKLKLASGSAELSQKDANDVTKAYIGLFANSLASLMFANGVNFTDGGANKQLNTTFGDITLQSTTGNVDLKSGAGKVRIYGQTGGVQIEGDSGDVDVNTSGGKKMNYNGNEVATFADIFTMIGYSVLQIGTANTLSANVINIIYNNNQLTSADTLTINGTTNQQALSYIRIGASMPTINGTAVGTIIGGGWKLNSAHLVLTIGGSVSIVMPLNLANVAYSGSYADLSGTDNVAVINPATSAATTLVAGKLNTLGSVDYATIALPATSGTAEYNGTFTSTTNGDITVSLPLNFWEGDTDIVTGKTYSFSIQNGVGFIIQLD